MKKIILILAILIATLSVISQDITGEWYGVLKVPGAQLNVVFNISESDGVYSATMDSPDQGAYAIPMDYVELKEQAIAIGMKAQMMEYKGELSSEGISGIFSQGASEFPLDLTREKKRKPQEPVEPYSYNSEEVVFHNKEANIQLKGTLTLPEGEGPFPAAILISGSGPQNRNEEILGHKPFLVLADHLTRNGIAVLRYDERGVGDSEGEFAGATSLDFAQDVESAFQYLKTKKKIQSSKIGLIGHSEGGLIAPMISADNPDVAFVVMLAGPGVNGSEIIIIQAELISRADGVDEEQLQKNKEMTTKIFDFARNHSEDKDLKEKLYSLMEKEMAMENSMEVPEGMTKEEFIQMQVDQITDPWFMFFLFYEPSSSLERVKCPILALNGELDLQVPSKMNLEAIKESARKGGNTKVETIEFPRLNHLFQHCETGAPSEYAEIEETFSPEVLEIISKWIINQ